MTTIPIPRGRARPAGQAAGDLWPVLLVCGVYSALLYAMMVVFVAGQWKGYSAASQTVSELSAVGAPTRPLWVTLGLFYTVLVTAFGLGVRLAAGRSRHLRVAGTLIALSGAMGLFWPPMHLRGSKPGLTDTLHIAFAVAWNLLAILTIVLAAAALGRRFRAYSVVTLAIFLVFGTLTGLAGPRIAANLPTPWVGVWERIVIGAYLLWVAVLAVTLLRTSAGREKTPAPAAGLPAGAHPAGKGPAARAARAAAGAGAESGVPGGGRVP